MRQVARSYFRDLCTEVHEILRKRRSLFAVRNVVFRLSISCFFLKIFAIGYEVVEKQSKNGQFWPQLLAEDVPYFGRAFEDLAHF